MSPYLAKCLLSGFGLGLVPKGPGTVGSLGAVALYLVVLGFDPHTWGSRSGETFYIIWAMVLASTGLCIMLSARLEKDYGNPDPPWVVLDEWAGQWVTLLFLSLLDIQSPGAFLGYTGLAFVFFRVFDIWKPFPVRELEKVSWGIGLVADDLAAGVYGGLCVYLVHGVCGTYG